MDVSLTNAAIWEEIERSESYLVCCMFEKATSLASSVIQRLCTSNSSVSIEDTQLADMMESAGMVLVQSLKELGRTPQILDELIGVFGVVTAIPIEVLLTGACFQISEGSHSGLSQFLEEFLGKWRLVDGQFYALSTAESNGAYLKGTDGHCILEIEKYLEVVEVYVVSFLGMVLKDSNHAILWVVKADLPEENRQELLRRIHSLYSLEAANSSQDAEKTLKADKFGAHSDSSKDSTLSKTQGSSLSSKGPRQPNGGTNNTKQNIFKLTEQLEPCFWWYRTVTLKFGSARLVISNGKMVLWSLLILFASYVLRKKHATLKRIVGNQVLAVKKAVVDMWDLAFSVQVNPLAAIQPLTGPTQGSR